MIVTPQIAEAMYSCLKSMKPFSSWNLPDADLVGFHINGSKINLGGHNHHTNAHHLHISQINVDDFETLATTIAHEIIHMRQLILSKNRNHNNLFMECASQICDELCWRLKDLR